MNKLNFLTVKQAAKESDSLDQVIYRAFNKGRIRGFRKDGKIFIERSSFAQWVASLDLRRELFEQYRSTRKDLTSADVRVSRLVAAPA